MKKPTRIAVIIGISYATFNFLFISLFFISPALNDMNAKNLASSAEKMPLPKHTQLIETISGCGNTSGTGNHTDMWVGTLIKTTLDEKAITAFYQNQTIQKVDNDNKQTLAMKIIDISFSHIEDMRNYDGVYIVETVERNDFLSFFDLRGH